jgi:hypothetical protein
LLYFNIITMKINQYFLLVLGVIMLCSACEIEDADWTYSTDNTVSDFGFEDVYNLSNGEAQSHNELRSCGAVRIDTTANTYFPVTLTFDFGTGTTCVDGRTRAGQLTAVYTDRWSAPGMTCTVTSTNYKVNNHGVSGTQVITNKGLVNGSLTFESVITNGVVTLPNGSTITRTATKNWAWIAGAATPLDISDDVYQLTGTASGTTRNGNAYTATITTPLVKANSCTWVQEGRIEVTPAGGGTTRAIDYGNGSCDATAEVSYGRWSTTIALN